MLNPSNPSAGVYTNIIDLSERTPNVTTSIAAFVGPAERGDVGVPVLLFDKEDRRAKFGDLNPQKYGFSGYCADTFLKVANRAYYVRVVNNAKTALAYLSVDDLDATNPVIRLSNNVEDRSTRPLGVVDPMKNVGFLPTDPGVENIPGFFCAKDPGLWNQELTIIVHPSNPARVPIRGNGHNPRHFKVSIYQGRFVAGSAPTETFLVSRSYEVNENGQQMFIEDVINSGSKLVRYKNNALCPLFDVVTMAEETLAGGTDGDAVTDDQIMEAWNLYLDSERIDVGLLVNAGYTSHAVHHHLANIAKKRGDSFAILDMPRTMQSPSAAANYRRNILNMNSYYAGIYTPYVVVYDKFTDRQLEVPISGHVAAVFAFMDANRAYWFAPAGMDVATLDVLGITEMYKQGARDALDEAQINYVRKLPRGAGYVLWNQSTLYSVTSSLQNINVSRLSMTILKACSKFTRNKLFDPNDSFLRAEVQAEADSFMEPIKTGRGVYEYSNVCDSRNNPADVVGNGDLVLDMIYDPTIFTKRVHVRFNLNPKGSRMTDVA